MKINLLTNTDSAGLYQDVCILKNLLESMLLTPPTAVEVRVINNFSPSLDTFGQGADLSIFLESLNNGQHYLQYARANWLVVNPEWYYPDQFDRYLPLISLIVCKTHHAHFIWSMRIGENRCLYTGFESRDMLVDGLHKTDGFIHVAGKSEAKGTDVIAEAWQRLPYPLTIVTRAQNQAESQATYRMAELFRSNPVVRHLHNLSDEQLARELSLHRFAIQPSLYEGYGHSIHEALSARCIVLTTDAPPMNGFTCGDRRTLIPVVRRVPRMMVEFNYCSADGVRKAVETSVKMSPYDQKARSEWSRDEWERERNFFRKTFTDAINRWGEWI